jgi:hypothetical protein
MRGGRRRRGRRTCKALVGLPVRGLFNNRCYIAPSDCGNNCGASRANVRFVAAENGSRTCMRCLSPGHCGTRYGPQELPMGSNGCRAEFESARQFHFHPPASTAPVKRVCHGKSDFGLAAPRHARKSVLGATFNCGDIITPSILQRPISLSLINWPPPAYPLLGSTGV